MDAKIAPQGVIIASEFTASVHLVTRGDIATRGEAAKNELRLSRSAASINNLLEGREPTINVLANLVFRKTISLLKPTF